MRPTRPSHAVEDVSQRCFYGRYRLLLSELLAQTWPAHRDFLDLEMAAELAAAMGAAMNQTIAGDPGASLSY